MQRFEKTENEETDAGDEDHRLEDAIGRKVIDDAAGGVEVEHDAAPEEEEGDAQVVSE
jgi:hypothetical protein